MTVETEEAVKTVATVWTPEFVMNLVLGIINGFIAFVATFIAVMEYRRAKRDEKKDQHRRSVLLELCKDFGKLDGLIKFCETYKEKKKEDEESVAKEQKTDMQMAFDNVIAEPTTVETINIEDETGLCKRLSAYAQRLGFLRRATLIEDSQVFIVIEKAYETFLRYEESFSLSYGYDRFINAFRGMVLLKKEYYSIDERTKPEEAEEIYERVYNEMKNITPYIREVQIKCDAMNDELNKGSKKGKRPRKK